jgi:hypothetical protein
MLLALLLLGLISNVFLIPFFFILSKKTDRLNEAPYIDWTLGLVTWMPWVVIAYLMTWREVGSYLVGQLLAFHLLCVAHRFYHINNKVSIIGTLNHIVGFTRNQLGFYTTLLAFPIFIGIRLSQVFLYPVLLHTIGLPKQNTKDWINISRHKIDGLIGYDLISCLYCDWMTGVYSLGAEMLRNVESFWCPLRFYNKKKCDNCSIDFPDIKQWVPSDKDVVQVVKVLQEKYENTPHGKRSWWGKR